MTVDQLAVWNIHRPKPGKSARYDGLDAWECTIFRNETSIVSSKLIRSAVEVCRLLALGAFECRTAYEGWGSVPKDGIITYVDPAHVKSDIPGYCFRRAGWRRIGYASDGKPLLRAPLPKLPTEYLTEAAQ